VIEEIKQVLFSPQETAKILNISRSQVYVLLNEGRIKSVKVMRSRKITKNAIEEFVKDLELNHSGYKNG
jgi:excisionase family DNA binding protein